MHWEYSNQNNQTKVIKSNDSKMTDFLLLLKIRVKQTKNLNYKKQKKIISLQSIQSVLKYIFSVQNGFCHMCILKCWGSNQIFILS